MANISVDKLADMIVGAVREYSEDVNAAVEKKVDETAKQVLKETKKLAPKKTGQYARGFGVTKEDGLWTYRRTVWNKKDYSRVHLLEFGHAKVNGGRVSARPHLRPAYDRFGANLDKEIKKIIQNGG